jgi:AraC family transcriptional regulator
MEPEIKTISTKKIVGKHIRMSLTNNQTGELWKSFLPGRKRIANASKEDLISIQVYPPFYFENFNPGQIFEKWAAVEVEDFHSVPEDMENFLIPGGLYAVFHYKGSGTDTSIYEYIFGTWIPNSGFLLDDRPHFELLGNKYKNDDPESEEDIYIPIKLK